MKTLKIVDHVLRFFAVAALTSNVIINIVAKDYDTALAWAIALSWCLFSFVVETLNESMLDGYRKITKWQSEFIEDLMAKIEEEVLIESVKVNVEDKATPELEKIHEEINKVKE